MKVLSIALFLFLMPAISWLDYRLTGHVHAALMLPAGLITLAFSFVKEKKTNLLVLSALILILSFAKRNSDPRQMTSTQNSTPVATIFLGR